MVTTRPPVFYRIIQLLTAPFVAFYLVTRWVTRREYQPFFLERLGRLPESFSGTRAGSIWLHAVSLGEVASAVPLLQELRKLFPGTPLYLSVSTLVGRRVAERQAAHLVDGLLYSPLDYASMVRRTLRALRPALLIILETEIWPNLYYETVSTGARLVIVNGRISDRTWPQYQAWRWLFSKVLQWPDLILVQGATDYERYRKLGVAEDRLAIAGNLKYDAAYCAKPARFPNFGAKQIWIAASTVGPNDPGSFRRHDIDEDDLVLDAFEKLSREFPQLLLILAPRQPYRFPVVAKKLERRELSFIRRSALTQHPELVLHLPGVLLLDTIGELASLYELADVVFVGGSIAPRGGHNILEPGAAGAAIVTGVYMQNFETIVRDFLQEQAIMQVRTGDELCRAVRELLLHPGRNSEMGARARNLVNRSRGVAALVGKRLEPLYYGAALRPPWGGLSRALLTPLAFIWKLGGAAKRNHAEQRADSLVPLPVPVISIGGITVGGAGKTPFVSCLAAGLRNRGHSPAILTRGYRRRYPAEHLIFERGAKVSPFFTGDEAQILLRAAQAPIGIGARRYETARILLHQFPETDLLLLDDGFQHALMPRDIDIVLIDGLDPFGQEDLVPLGRLREPLTALERAHIFVVTRAADDRRFAAIKRRLSQYNARAPVFRTHLVIQGWRDYATGEAWPELRVRKVGAFCGLGNPQGFWDTLESLGLEVVLRWEFSDHHSYRPVELFRVAQQARMNGAQMLVTTEKDRINCPSGLGKSIAPFSLAWLEIGFELENEPEFFRYLGRTLENVFSA